MEAEVRRLGGARRTQKARIKARAQKIVGVTRGLLKRDRTDAIMPFPAARSLEVLRSLGKAKKATHKKLRDS
jgi:hypothetical protein